MNKAQLIIFGSIGAIVVLALAVILGVLPGLKERPVRNFSLEIWGTEDSREIWDAIINRFREEVAKGAEIKYVKKDPRTYEEELLNALASGKGPDIFSLADSELQTHRDKLKPLIEGELEYERKNLKTIFADGLTQAIADDAGALFGTPLAFDTLALFYNRDYLNAANIPSPPQTWDELLEQSRLLTKFSSAGGITRSGVALGTALNVAHAPDILLALILQSGETILTADSSGRGRSALQSEKTASALSFYTSFADTAKRTYAWNAFFEDSLAAFAKGDAVMAFGYAKDAKRVRELNPQLNFDTAPLPQVSRESPQVNLGRFSIFAVSRTTKEPENAWRFLLWLQGKDVEKTYIDLVGLPPARRDLAVAKPPREYLIPFYDQVLSARTIPIVLNGSFEEIFNDMIEAVATRRFSAAQALSRAASAINDILRAEGEPKAQ